MPVNLTDNVGNYPPNLTSPADGDDADEISISTAFQKVADRTSTLKQRIDNVAPTSAGVEKIQQFASVAALKATLAADRAANEWAHIINYGLFEWDAGSSATPDDRFVIKPTDVGGGSGRYRYVAHSYLDVASGIPTLDGAARVVASKVRSGIVARGMRSSGSLYTATPTLADIVGEVIDLDGLKAGDEVSAWGSLFGTSASVPGGIVSVVLRNKTAASDVKERWVEVNATSGGGGAYRAFSLHFVILADADYSVRLRRETAPNAATVADINWQAMAVRP